MGTVQVRGAGNDDSPACLLDPGSGFVERSGGLINCRCVRVLTVHEEWPPVEAEVIARVSGAGPLYALRRHEALHFLSFPHGSAAKLGNLGSSSSGLASANAAANGAASGGGEESLQWCHNGTHYLDGRGTIPPPGGAIVKQPWRTDGTNSQASAVVYVLVVLLLYALALAVVLIKYVRRERYEARLYHLCDEFMRRDRFLRLSKRHSSIRSNNPAARGDNNEQDEGKV
nr:uncharacterized protein LOC129381677 [Dermacentor andersoni]